MPSFLPKLVIGAKNIFKNYQLALLFGFWLVFFVVVAFEFLAIKSALKVVLEKPEPEPVNSSSKAVRINFENYSAVVGRIQKAGSFMPSESGSFNPFVAK